MQKLDSNKKIQSQERIIIKKLSKHPGILKNKENSITTNGLRIPFLLT